MRSSSLLLALAAAIGVTASRIQTNDVSSYLNSLYPVAKDVLLNQISGPSIGADVWPCFLPSPLLPQC